MAHCTGRPGNGRRAMAGGGPPDWRRASAGCPTLGCSGLGPAPEQAGFDFWEGELANKVRPASVAIQIYRSREHRKLVREHRGPQVGIVRAFTDALDSVG